MLKKSEGLCLCLPLHYFAGGEVFDPPVGRVQVCFVLGYSAPFSYQAHALVNHLSLWDLNLLNL